MTTATTISKTMATAAQKYGGGTINGASAFSAAALSAKLAVSLASVAVLLVVSLRADVVDNTALPRACAVHSPTPTLNPPPMSQPINATNGAVNPPSVGRYPSPGSPVGPNRRPRTDSAVKANKPSSKTTCVPSTA